MPPKKTVYKKMDHIQHVLARPDTYLGSTRMQKVEEYIAKNIEGEFQIEKTEINSSSGLLRIFIEALSNAIDNVTRSNNTSTKCTKIHIIIDQDSGKTSIFNDGDVVPIEFHESEKCYIHSMIFGQLMTGSNYNDEENRISSGRNGLGIKLCNIYSKWFQVKGTDIKQKKILVQEWTNNMQETSGPNITETTSSINYTKVSWIPDFSRFGIKGYTNDIISLYTKYILDAAMITKVDVSLNGVSIPINKMSEYAKLYKTPTDEQLYIKTKQAEVLITPSNGEYQHVSFINGVFTRLGGQHVDIWTEELLRPFVVKYNKKETVLSIRDIKQFFRIFINCIVIRPEFDSQDKNKFEGPKVTATVKKSQITTLMKWSVVNNIEDIIRSKEMLTLKKTERKGKIIKIEGLDQANNAGGKNSKDCTLILCEGLSAKTYAVAGIQKGVYGKQGRDWFGIYPLRGKLLNVRNSAIKAISSNKVITELIQAIGIKHNVDYTNSKNFNSLRYGKIMIMTDADVDGIHIEGLLLNFFHFLFPSLFNREQSYITSMKTPIVRIYRSVENDLLFYDERKFNTFINNQKNKVNIKYYKGLGTTKAEDVPDTFGLKMIEFVFDENTVTSMNKVFNKKNSDDRKEWLSDYSPDNNPFSLDDQGEIIPMNISSFIDNEMIKFSVDDCKRSIPSLIDGLKESQRKILYAVRKRKLKYSGKSLKVAQLGGYTAEHTNYHHGEQNLYDTVVKMANEFPGTNNIPLFFRDGQFGSRLEGGNDAASARYIFTKMEQLTPFIFRQEDDSLLTQINDDGDLVQPEYFIPIIPMILINGCTAGIGTGWSCKIPCFNPLDIIDCIKIWLDNDGHVIIDDIDNIEISLFPDLIPWYRGFNGSIIKDGDDRFITKGICNKKTYNSVKITELPIGMWTNKFKDICESLLQDKKLKSIKNYSSPQNVDFILLESDDFSCTVETLKLHSYLYTSNMVLFDNNGKLYKYNDINQILCNFCNIRFEFYIKRKQHQIDELEQELKYLRNKERFITEVINSKLDIMNIEESTLISTLESKKYDKKENEYNYLFSMQVRTFTIDKINKICNDIKLSQKTLDNIKKISEKDMWLNDLDEFVNEYTKWLKYMENPIISKKRK